MRAFKVAITGLILSGVILFCVWLVRIVPVDHWGFAISVNFLFMAFFSLVFGVLFEPNHSSRYFTSKRFERDGSIYRWLGVRRYSSLLRLIGWNKFIRKGQRIGHTRVSLQQFEAWTKGSEAVHASAAISVVAVTIWVGWRYSFVHIRWLVIINLLVNVYPAMLQRYNRFRACRLIRLQETRRAS